MVSNIAVLLMCAEAVSWSVMPADRIETCIRVGDAAMASGVDPSVAIALSYTESRFNKVAKSSRGAMGPLQVLPKYYCPKGTSSDCDLIDAGIQAIIRHQKRFGPRWREVLCHWNSGNKCYRLSRLFARKVMQRARLLRRGHGDQED